MNNQELWEIVNPVFNTAKSCVQLDAASGDEDSKQLLGALGFEQDTQPAVFACHGREGFTTVSICLP
ncbi:MAG: hypothetical protein IKG87_13890 [Clostridia bacterium]|nr:hypothetical protein [Clostridia bacterium]MBR4576678.1 hypothetical protein [Clostridia bacterium]